MRGASALAMRDGRAAESGEILGREVPVHQGPEVFQVLGTGIAVVDVVRVFPDITGQQRLVGRGQRGGGVAGVDDVDRAVGLLDQPGPARTEVAGGRLVEGFLEGVEAAPLGVDGVGQLAGRRAAGLGSQAVPVEGVVPDLRGVVEDATRGLLDDVFQRQVLELGARDQVVQVRDVGLVVLAVVELQRLFRDVRSQRVQFVRQGGRVCAMCRFLLLSARSSRSIVSATLRGYRVNPAATRG